MILHKQYVQLEVKELTDTGTFEGLLSPYGNVDGGGDVVEAGAYTKTLKERGNKVPLLWQHKSDTPIGELTLEERKDGLWCKGRILLELPEGFRAYTLLKAKIIRGLSIGFETVKDVLDGGIRRLKEIKLYEGSIVTFPMNEAAMVMAVKSIREKEGKTDFVEALAEEQLMDLGHQIICALREALCSTTSYFSDLSREERIALAETIIDQFKAAFMAYLPEYLDAMVAMYGPPETYAATKQIEKKAGATISQATATVIKSATDSIMAAHDQLTALLEAKAAAGTFARKAAPSQPEPGDHSAVHSLINQIRENL